MGILSILSELAEVGITRGQLNKALVESTEAREKVIAKTKQVQAYWKSIAPVTDRKSHPVQKGSSEIIHPEDYRNAIKVKYEKGKDGRRIAAPVERPTAMSRQRTRRQCLSDGREWSTTCSTAPRLPCGCAN